MRTTYNNVTYNNASNADSVNHSSLAHRERQKSQNGYPRSHHFHKREERQENKSPTPMAREQLVLITRHLVFLVVSLALFSVVVAFLALTNKTGLAELVLGLFQR